MRFLVTRTSQSSYDEQPPCDGLQRMCWTETLEYVEESTPFVPYWAREGGGTHFENGSWVRYLPEWSPNSAGVSFRDGVYRKDIACSGWVIDLADLGTLVAFVSEQGRVIVSPADEDHASVIYPQIEIYDDYRE